MMNQEKGNLKIVGKCGIFFLPLAHLPSLHSRGLVDSSVPGSERRRTDFFLSS
jgi:hypothetical protein